VIAGMIVAVMDWIFPHKFSTILEVDYDTPYDRHVIIEENKQAKRPRIPHGLEQPLAVGSRLWRRVSRRQSGNINDPNKPRYADHRLGMVNDAFEMDPPKSPWRYPQFLHTPRFQHSKAVKSVSFRHDVSKPHLSVPGFQNFKRTDSQDSSISSDSQSSTDNVVELHVPDFHQKYKQQMKEQSRDSDDRSRSKASKRNSDTSMISSIGLAALVEEDGGVSREGSSKQSYMTAPPDGRSSTSELATGGSYETAESTIGSDHRKLSQESDSALYRGRGHQNVSRRFSADPVKVRDQSGW